MRATLAEELARRRRDAMRAPAIARLAQRLARLLDPLVRSPLYLPEEKPLLSRDGGVCAHDGARLLFDPLSPHEHRCPVCGALHAGDRHHRAWIWRYHLWLSERAIHLALVSALGADAAFAARAADILERYADLYPRVPNRDNVLGPTRLFFSTYLEAIWLTQVVIAGLIVGEASLHAALDPVVAESARLIASFDEGRSNRQVWNATALLAAGTWLGDSEMRDAAVAGRRGLVELHRSGVTSSGLWYEGENYHFFALRAFVLGAEIARWAGAEVPSLRAMHEAPLDTVLPDLTLPARGDAPYGVSVAQPRFADLWEVGWARTESERLEATLAALYDLDLPTGHDPGSADIAEQEVNRAPARLTREGLSWKALFWMRPEEPRAESRPPARATLLEDAGIAVLRASPGVYVSVECGGQPGGHGHPDLLHLSVFLDRPFLADFGTGSYVNPSLPWYRSALAHNAPVLAERGQTLREGWCAAVDERDGWTWCQCEARDICGRGSSVRRSVVACEGWVLDVVEVYASPKLMIDLPVHQIEGLAVRGARSAAESLRVPGVGDAGHESGYDCVRWLGEASAETVHAGGLALAPRSGEMLLVGEAPGPPTVWFADGAPLKFLVRRAPGTGTWIQAVFTRHGGAVRTEGDMIVVAAEAVYRVRVAAGAVTIRLPDGGTLRLAGERTALRIPTHSATVPRARPLLIHAPRLHAVPDPREWETHVAGVTLDEAAYRRAEESYSARGPFRAQVGVFVVGDRLCFGVSVVKSHLTFRPAGVVDERLDNEAPDIHSDGVQCYVGSGDWRGWVLVPRQGAGVMVRPVVGTAATAEEVRARWERASDGYRMVIEIAMASALVEGERVPVNVIINEMYPDRARRAGQLALSGGGGWVYLRGDRESPAGSAQVEVT